MTNSAIENHGPIISDDDQKMLLWKNKNTNNNKRVQQSSINSGGKDMNSDVDGKDDNKYYTCCQ